MKNQLTAGIKHQRCAGSRWFARRSQAAGVLLTGWLFFWIVGIVTPCCVAFARAPDDDAMNQAMSTEEHAGHGGMSTGPVHQHKECPLAFTADAPLSSQVFIVPAVTDHTPHLIVVSHIEPLLAVADSSNPFVIYHPSPPPRIYLRTLRLRI